MALVGGQFAASPCFHMLYESPSKHKLGEEKNDNHPLQLPRQSPPSESVFGTGDIWVLCKPDTYEDRGCNDGILRKTSHGLLSRQSRGLVVDTGSL